MKLRRASPLPGGCGRSKSGVPPLRADMYRKHQWTIRRIQSRDRMMLILLNAKSDIFYLI
jgi:hypothetical protein